MAESIKREIVLPDFHINLVRLHRRGPLYASVSDLIGYLYKAAADPQQDSTSAFAFKCLAETLEEVQEEKENS